MARKRTIAAMPCYGSLPYYYSTRFYSCALPRATEVMGYRRYQLPVQQTLQLRAKHSRADAPTEPGVAKSTPCGRNKLKYDSYYHSYGTQPPMQILILRPPIIAHACARSEFAYDSEF